MEAKHWSGLVVILLFLHLEIRVDGMWLKFDEDTEASEADAGREGSVCYYADDCQLDECCLANNRPIGKRSTRNKRWFQAASSEGTCRKLGTIDSSCILPVSGVVPDPREEVIAMDVCPCEKSLTCFVSDNATYVVPQGHLGSCQKITQTSNNDDLLKLIDENEAAATEDQHDNNDDGAGDDRDNNDSDNTDRDNKSVIETEPSYDEDEQVIAEEEEKETAKVEEDAEEQPKMDEDEEDKDDTPEDENLNDFPLESNGDGATI